MYLSKFNLFRETKSEEEIIKEQELEKKAQEITGAQNAVFSMKKTKGWKLTEQYLLARIELLKEKLVRKDDMEARAEIKATKDLLNFIERMVVGL